MEKTHYEGAVGTIIYLNPGGWGFINSHDIQFEKIYFHWSGLVRSPNFKKLDKGMSVRFNAHLKTLPSGEKKWKAIQVEVINNGGQTEARRD